MFNSSELTHINIKKTRTFTLTIVTKLFCIVTKIHGKNRIKKERGKKLNEEMKLGIDKQTKLFIGHYV